MVDSFFLKLIAPKCTYLLKNNHCLKLFVCSLLLSTRITDEEDEYQVDYYERRGDASWIAWTEENK